MCATIDFVFQECADRFKRDRKHIVLHFCRCFLLGQKILLQFLCGNICLVAQFLCCHCLIAEFSSYVNILLNGSKK
jgi:hypothetical protein